MTYRRKYQEYFRRPVSFQQYYVLLVRSHGYWEIDSQSWNENEIEHAKREEKRLNPQNQVKIITSPSDNEEVITRLVREMNRFAR